LHGEGDKGQ